MSGDTSVAETSLESQIDNTQSEEESRDVKESNLLIRVKELELLDLQNTEKIKKLENDLKSLIEEKNNQKNENIKLQEEITELRKNPAETTEVQVMKEQSEELLVRAKGIIFEKTKVCQNQELQIEALSQQVMSLKEVLGITKDLLDIRNLELKQLEDKLNIMEQKISVEKERHELMQKKMDKMLEMNTELKREYETQLVLFTALRERYNERELARDVVDELRVDLAQSRRNEEGGNTEKKP